MSAFIGHAGEYYVLYQLYRQGLLAALSPRGTAAADVLVLAPDESVNASLQVKTKTGGRGWFMRERHERLVAPRFFYAFVDLAPEAPVTYIVPSAVVADALRSEHEAWLAAPERRGPHKENAMRELRPAYRHPVPGCPDGWLEIYRERWDLLSTGKEESRERSADET